MCVNVCARACILCVQACVCLHHPCIHVHACVCMHLCKCPRVLTAPPALTLSISRMLFFLRHLRSRTFPHRSRTSSHSVSSVPPPSGTLVCQTFPVYSRSLVGFPCEDQAYCLQFPHLSRVDMAPQHSKSHPGPNDEDI